jgi:hypothetical protein
MNLIGGGEGNLKMGEFIPREEIEEFLSNEILII